MLHMSGPCCPNFYNGELALHRPVDGYLADSTQRVAVTSCLEGRANMREYVVHQIFHGRLTDAAGNRDNLSAISRASVFRQLDKHIERGLQAYHWHRRTKR